MGSKIDNSELVLGIIKVVRILEVALNILETKASGIHAQNLNKYNKSLKIKAVYCIFFT